VLPGLVLGAALFLIWFVPFFLQHGLPASGRFYEVYIELHSGLQFFFFESRLASDSFLAGTLLVAAYGFFKLRGERFLKEWVLLGALAPLVFGNRLNEQLLFPLALVFTRVFLWRWKDFLSAFKLSFLPEKPFAHVFAIYVLAGALVAGGSLVFFQPQPEDVSAMQWLEQNTPLDSVVLAPWFSGHWVSGIAQRKNVIDAYAEYAPGLDERYADSVKAFYSGDSSEIKRVLAKYGVSFVYCPKSYDEIFCTGVSYLQSEGVTRLVFENKGYWVFKVER